jgi:hypothetical protein
MLVAMITLGAKIHFLLRLAEAQEADSGAHTKPPLLIMHAVLSHPAESYCIFPKRHAEAPAAGPSMH